MLSFLTFRSKQEKSLLIGRAKMRKLLLIILLAVVGGGCGGGGFAYPGYEHDTYYEPALYKHQSNLDLYEPQLRTSWEDDYNLAEERKSLERRLDRLEALEESRYELRRPEGKSLLTGRGPTYGNSLLK
jgi:hypothetical protein